MNKISRNKLVLNGERLSSLDVYNFINNPNSVVSLDKKALAGVDTARKYVDGKMVSEMIYGVNTGFGPMASRIISKHELSTLQLNLIRSHAAGAGKPISSEYVLAAMLIRLNTLLKGYSGVSRDLLIRMATFINHRIIPVVPEHGAVGTSGDLVQLAHIALALIGEGEVEYGRRRYKTRTALAKLKLALTYSLKPKEGLALINGTSVMSAIAVVVVCSAVRLLDIAVRTGGLALEIADGYSDSVDTVLHMLRPHSGQSRVAEKLRKILKTSKLIKERTTSQKITEFTDKTQDIHKPIQEFYSLRCIPQILGPTHEAIDFLMNVVDTEINSVSDNPIVDVKRKRFLHGGNFHGDYVATAVDQLKVPIVKMTILSERRLNFFLHEKINEFLPPFVNMNVPGLTLGMQGIQFVATSTTALSQTLAYPHSLHSISTNSDNQDVVSMGTEAALLAERVLKNAYIVHSIELIALAQAVDILEVNNELSIASKDLYSKIRKSISVIKADRSLSQELNILVNRLIDHSALEI